jgi:hypothetical protein
MARSKLYGILLKEMCDYSSPAMWRRFSRIALEVSIAVKTYWTSMRTRTMQKRRR